MSASSPSGTRIEGRGDVDGPSGGIWLARGEMKRAWRSYPLTGLFVLLLGILVVPGLSGVFEFRGFGARGERLVDFYNAFFPDYLFLVVCAFLGVNAISYDYTPAWRDAFSSRLLFLRSLPIPASSLVASRALGMLFALAIDVPAFFLPVYFFSDLGELGASYLPFCGIWIGYGLLGAGLCLLLELTVSGRAFILAYLGLAAALAVVLAILGWTVNLSLVWETAELARSYGALPAVFSVMTGAAAFALLARATVHRVERRDLSA